MRFRRVWSLFRVRNNEFFRDRAALGWNFLFPVLVVFGFAFAFSGPSQKMFKVDVVGQDSPGLARDFLALPSVSSIGVKSVDEGLPKLRRHQVDMVLDAESVPPRYWINDSSPKGALLEKLLAAKPADSGFQRQTVEGREIRYVDWLIAGLLGMNMMFGSLFGVGYVIVRYRKSGVLKRLKATPIKPIEFVLAQVLSRLWIVLFTAVLVYAGTNFFLKFQMHGSYLTLFLVAAIGALSLISLGLVVAARTASEEFAGGLLNMLSSPMMFLSGVWFSLEGAHPVVQAFAKIFPLTHLVDAARLVMTEGAGMAQVAPQLSILGVSAVVFLALGAWSFRWE